MKLMIGQTMNEDEEYSLENAIIDVYLLIKELKTLKPTDKLIVDELTQRTDTVKNITKEYEKLLKHYEEELHAFDEPTNFKTQIGD